jgi:hypothetical protein
MKMAAKSACGTECCDFCGEFPAISATNKRVQGSDKTTAARARERIHPNNHGAPAAVHDDK